MQLSLLNASLSQFLCSSLCEWIVNLDLSGSGDSMPSFDGKCELSFRKTNKFTVLDENSLLPYLNKKTEVGNLHSCCEIRIECTGDHKS